jgi:hypothetical protein
MARWLRILQTGFILIGFPLIPAMWNPIHYENAIPSQKLEMMKSSDVSDLFDTKQSKCGD